MKVRKHIIEKSVVLCCLMHMLMGQTLGSIVFITAEIILMAVSIVMEKGKPYTPAIILTLLIDILRSRFDSLWIVEIFLIILCLYLFRKLRFFELTQHFRQFEKQTDEQLQKVGYRSAFSDGLGIGVYYPAENIQNCQKATWHPSWDYSQRMYNSLYIDPRTKRRLPQWLVRFCTSYLTTYRQEAYRDAPFKEAHKIVLMSHGLAAHKKMLSNYACWYASRGYVVISANHRHDQICVDFREHASDVQKCHQFIYDRRHASLKTRVQEFSKLFDLVKGGWVSQFLKKPVKIEAITLFGHSFGGTTVLSTASQMKSHQIYPLIERIVCLDPWLFPLSEQCYQTLHKPMLFINTDRFVRTNPQFYKLHDKKHRLASLNDRLTKIYLKQSDHLHHSDAAQVFGTLLESLGAIKNYNLTEFFNEMTVLAIYKFEKGLEGNALISKMNEEATRILVSINEIVAQDNRKLWQQD